MEDTVEESVTYRLIIRKGAEQSMREMALKMLQRGMSFEAIADITGLSIDQLHQIQANASAPTES